jgi:hypothetical protein
VISPSLKTALHTSASYEAFVATGTIGLLIPLNTMFAGIGVLVDRESGAQRELLTAPISRGLLVVANLLVAFLTRWRWAFSLRIGAGASLQHPGCRPHLVPRCRIAVYDRRTARG